MPLTDPKIRALKATDKEYKVTDERGLYLLVKPNGSKLWMMKYRLHGREKKLSFGRYPDVTLAAARKQRDQAKLDLKDAVDPAVKKKLKRIEAEVGQRNTFAAVVDDYLAKIKKEGCRDATYNKNEWLLVKLAGPELGSRPIADIKPIEILSLLQKVERSGRHETAHRLRGTIGTVYRYAIATLRAETDPTFALRGALTRVQVKHRPAITAPAPFGRLLQLIDEYDGWPTLTACLKIQALCFARPYETRTMTWAEVDLQEARWTIPAEKMKMGTEHDVPLSRQAVEVLRDIRKLTGRGRLVFSSIRSDERPLSENAMNSALRRMGIATDEHCAHGFRSSASTILNSRRFDRDVIEVQLSHLDGDEVRRAYNRSLYWPERVEMMQAWADICDELKGLRGPEKKTADHEDRPS